MSDRRLEIVGLGQEYSVSRRNLAALVLEIREEQRAVLWARWDDLQRLRTETQTACDMLRDAVERNPDLFERPRTWAVDDVRIGYRKKPGKLEWANDAAVVGKIMQRHPDREDLLRTKVTPNRSALKNLSGRELAALGVTVTDDQDVLVVETAKDDLEKLLQVLLDEGAQEAEPEAGEIGTFAARPVLVVKRPDEQQV